MDELEPYLQRVYEARNTLLDRKKDNLQRSMIIEYINQIERVIRLIESGDISQDNADRLIAELRRALQAWQALLGQQAKRSAIETIDGVGRIHSNTVSNIAADFDAGISINLNGFRADAFESMFARRELDMVKTYKTLDRWNANGGRAVAGIERIISDGIADGTSWRDIQQQIGRGLMAGSPEFGRIPDDISISSFMRGQPDPVKDNIRKLMADARRIAVTEIDVAYHEGERVASARNPIVKALKWQTSGRHDGLYSSPDICDVYEQADLYGLGEGVYYPEVIPVKPHPNCACTRTFVTRPANEWDQPKETPTQPRQASANEVNRILEENKHSGSRTLTDRYLETTTAQTRNDVQKAFNYRNRAEAA